MKTGPIRRATMLVAVAGTGLLLAGCGDDARANQNATSDPNASDPATAQNDNPTDAPSDAVGTPSASGDCVFQVKSSTAIVILDVTGSADGCDAVRTQFGDAMNALGLSVTLGDGVIPPGEPVCTQTDAQSVVFDVYATTSVPQATTFCNIFIGHAP